MKIIDDYPPNYKEIADTFNLTGRPGIVFTYGDVLYNPSGAKIDLHLMKHEETHMHEQRKIGRDAWWKRYLVDQEFRLEQELKAYRAQHKCLKQNYPRDYRRLVTQQIAKDLSSKMYGNIVTKEEAKRLITDA